MKISRKRAEKLIERIRDMVAYNKSAKEIQEMMEDCFAIKPLIHSDSINHPPCQNINCDFCNTVKPCFMGEDIVIEGN